jgi:hypothetical protein
MGMAVVYGRARAPPHSQTHPACNWHALCVASALHGVTVPPQTDDVDSHTHPVCIPHVLWVDSCAHGVRVPVHGVAPALQVQPGVVQVLSEVAAPHAAIVPVHVDE